MIISGCLVETIQEADAWKLRQLVKCRGYHSYTSKGPSLGARTLDSRQRNGTAHRNCDTLGVVS